MRQSIEKKRETKSVQNSVTAMFHDRNGFLDVSGSFRARESAVSSPSDALAVGSPVVSSVLSLPSILKASGSGTHSRHRTRRRTSQQMEKFPAEEPMARSALTVLAVNPNKGGAQATANVITTMTEQRRCAAA